MHDLVIRNAQIVDGSGAPASRGDVAVDGAQIVAVGRVEGSGAREMDAAGRVLSPGFIDVHTHSDLMLLAEPAHEAKVRQGITTDLLGLDGIGYAPLPDDQQTAFRDYFAALNGDPAVEGDWSSVAGWLASFDGAAAINAAQHLPHGCVRGAVVGWEDRPATPEELRAMQDIAQQAFADGAVALSTGLDYLPCAFGDTEELIALGEVAARFGAPYVAHMRSRLGKLDAMRETVTVGRRAGCPVHFSHFNSGGRRWWNNLDEADRGTRTGVPISYDTYAWPAGSTLLHFNFPEWTMVGGVTAMLERLSDAATRARIVQELLDRRTGRAVDWSRAQLSSVPSPERRALEGHRVSALAREARVDPDEFVVDLVWREGGRVTAVYHNDATDDDFEMVMRHPGQMCSTDAVLIGGSPHPRTYGTYPRFLQRFVRERQTLPVEAMVRRMTGLPAARFGLLDRGQIRPGMAADLVLIDLEIVENRATFDDPRQFPIGIDDVIVNGTFVIDDGRHTGATPGRGLRRGRVAAA